MQPNKRLSQFGLAVALDASDREDLAGPNLEVYPIHNDVSGPICDRQPRNLQAALAGLGRILLHLELDRTPDHERRELVCRILGRSLGDDLAVADHGDAVCDLAHLAQLVRDEHDRGAIVAELPHDLHKVVGLLRREDGGRLVKDEDLCVTREGLDDLDALLHANWQILDNCVGIHLEPEALSNLSHVCAGARKIEGTGKLRAFVAEHHVLGDREHRHEHEVLVHHSDARRHRVARAPEMLHLAADDDLALVWLVQPVEHVHEGGFAGTVLAQQGVNLSGSHLNGDAVVRGK